MGLEMEMSPVSLTVESLVLTVHPNDVLTPLVCQGSMCMVAGALE